MLKEQSDLYPSTTGSGCVLPHMLELRSKERRPSDKTANYCSQVAGKELLLPLAVDQCKHPVPYYAAPPFATNLALFEVGGKEDSKGAGKCFWIDCG
jgi:hypothetical protein